MHHDLMHGRLFDIQDTDSKQLEVVQFVPILHDVLLDLAAHAPGHEIFHAPSLYAIDSQPSTCRNRGSHASYRGHKEIRTTRYAGSVTTSVPTRICPCSMCWIADFSVSAILNRVNTTGSLLLANADTLICSAAESFEADDRMPMSYSLSRSSCSCFRRTGLSGGIKLKRCANCRMDNKNKTDKKNSAKNFSEQTQASSRAPAKRLYLK